MRACDAGEEEVAHLLAMAGRRQPLCKKRGALSAPLFRIGHDTSCPCKCTDGARLEFETQGQLRLTRVSDAKAQEAVEVEKSRRRERVDVVLVIEGVEHFDLRNHGEAFAETERTGDAEVEREEGVVFAKGVASSVDTILEARLGGDGLR